MANVIKLKYGSGVPGDGQLVTGEIGLDLTNKVIYAADAMGDIVEMGRNMGEGGTIEWDQINPDSIPPELNIIINGEIPEYISLDALVAQVKANEDAITALEAWETTAKGQISKLESDVAKNAGDIATNIGDIGDLKTSQGQQDLKIKANEDGVKDLDGRVTVNEGEISDIKALLDQDLTGLALGGTYSVEATVENNTIVDVTGSGAAHGFSVGDRLNAHMSDDDKGWYFVVQGTGELSNLSREGSNGATAQNGDWLVSDGTHGWILMSFGGDHVTWGTIGGNIDSQTDLQDQFATKLGVDDTIEGGTYKA